MKILKVPTQFIINMLMKIIAYSYFIKFHKLYFSALHLGSSHKHAATDANVEENLSDNNVHKVELIAMKNNRAEGDINGNKDTDRQKSPDRQYIKSVQDQSGHPGEINPLSLKQRKSVENIVQKHMLEYSDGGKSATAAGQKSQTTQPVAVVDPKLKLLDNQLRHILKNDNAVDGATEPLRKSKQQEGGDGEQHPMEMGKPVDSGGGVMHRSLELVVDTVGTPGVPPTKMTRSLERQDFMRKSGSERHSTEMKDSANNIAIRFEQDAGNVVDGYEDEVLILECTNHGKPQKRDLTVDIDGINEGGRVLHNSASAFDKNLMFSGVDEKSYNTYMYTQAVMGDEPTHGLDTNAAKLAPCTVVTQFNLSMASSEEDSDGEESIKGDTSNVKPQSQSYSPYSEHQKRGTMMKQMQDVSERITEKLNAREIGKIHPARRELFHNLDNSRIDSEADSLGANNSRSAQKDLQSLDYRPVKSILEEIPRPKYSSHSPGSPAKSLSSSLSSKPGPSPLKALPMLSKVKEVSSEFNQTGKSVTGDSTKEPPCSDKMKEEDEELEKLLQVNMDELFMDKHQFLPQKDAEKSGDKNRVDNAAAIPVDDISGSDTEASRNILNNEAIREKLLALKLEERGVADGESPRQNSAEEAIKHVGKDISHLVESNDKAEVLIGDDKEGDVCLTMENGPIISVPFSPIITRVPDVFINRASLDRGPLAPLQNEDLVPPLSPPEVNSKVTVNTTPIEGGVNEGLNICNDDAIKENGENMIPVSNPAVKENEVLHETVQQSEEIGHPIPNCEANMIGEPDKVSISLSKSSEVPHKIFQTVYPHKEKVGGKSLIIKSRLPIRDMGKQIHNSGSLRDKALPPSPKKSTDGPKKSESAAKREKVRKSPTKSAASPSRSKGMTKKEAANKALANSKLSSIPVKGLSPKRRKEPVKTEKSSPKKSSNVTEGKCLTNGTHSPTHTRGKSTTNKTDRLDNTKSQDKDKNKNPVIIDSPKRIVKCDNDFDVSSQGSSTSNSPRAVSHIARSRSKKRSLGRDSSSKERPTLSMIAGGGASQADDLSLVHASVDVYMLEGGREDPAIRPKPPSSSMTRNARVSSRAR